ncbi:CLUMA_CG012441, isoform A [Clunio marinus]|uniref:CLUMA_CG012441, isoform A n=1 Tax=Clunio marinus TaxID=568069 RepID=A0A1J1IFQ0_9DIPT|nr:CLUMA_CG012441, isoform A [Clunio marinus]
MNYHREGATPNRLLLEKPKRLSSSKRDKVIIPIVTFPLADVIVVITSTNALDASFSPFSYFTSSS